MTFHAILRGAAAALLTAAALGAPAAAQTVGDVGVDGAGNVYTYTVGANGQGGWVRGRNGAGTERRILAERYIPGIWIDPDGCEHWVMDDGMEGYMTPHVRRDGTPVCNRSR